MSDIDRHRLHTSLEFIGMRAQAVATGLVQMCIELKRANVLDDAAIGRIKDSIAEEIAERAPRSVAKQVYLKNIRERLDRIFEGAEPVGQLPPAADEPAEA